MRVEEIFTKSEIEDFLRKVMGKGYEELIRLGVPYNHLLFIYLRLMYPTISSDQVMTLISSDVREATLRELIEKKEKGAVIVKGFMTLEQEDRPVAYVCPQHRVPVDRGWVCPICGRSVRSLRIYRYVGVISGDGVSVGAVYIGDSMPVSPLGSVVRVLGIYGGELLVLRILERKDVVVKASGEEGVVEEGERFWRFGSGEEVSEGVEGGVEALRKYLVGVKVRGAVVAVEELTRRFGVDEGVVEEVVRSLGGRVDDDGNVVF